jgi:hypothetical protein
MIHKTLHRNLNTDQQQPHYKLGMNSGVAEGWAVPVPLVASVVLLIVKNPISHDRGQTYNTVTMTHWT